MFKRQVCSALKLPPQAGETPKYLYPVDRLELQPEVLIKYCGRR